MKKKDDKLTIGIIILVLVASIAAALTIHCIIRRDGRWIGLLFFTLAALLFLVNDIMGVRDFRAGSQAENREKKKAYISLLTDACLVLGPVALAIYYAVHRDYRAIAVIIVMLMEVSIIVRRIKAERSNDDTIDSTSKKELLINFFFLIALASLLVYYIVRFDIRLVFLVFVLWRAGAGIVKKLGWIPESDGVSDAVPTPSDPTAQP